MTYDTDGKRNYSMLLHVCFLQDEYKMEIRKWEVWCYSTTDFTRAITLPCTSEPSLHTSIPPCASCKGHRHFLPTFASKHPAQCWKHPKAQSKQRLSLLSAVLKPMFVGYLTARFPGTGVLTWPGRDQSTTGKDHNHCTI